MNTEASAKPILATLEQLGITPEAPFLLPPIGAMPQQAHVFELEALEALDLALATGRPLLLRGEPGTGKSQLARAAAHVLKRPLATQVVDSQTEAQDLLWHFDAVARLAEAQLQGSLGKIDGEAQRAQLRRQLAVNRFVFPRALWWALDWEGAVTQSRCCHEPSDASLLDENHLEPSEQELGAPPRPAEGWSPGGGVVVLIDEIDKADENLPNGLLEVMGDRSFRPPGRHLPVTFSGGQPPLVVITTNEERALPDAFVRRCIVHQLTLPDVRSERELFIQRLCTRGEIHFGASRPPADSGKNGHAPVGPSVLRVAAELLADARLLAHDRDLPLPGQAEYLDLLRGVATLFADDAIREKKLMRLSRFTFRKHRALAEDEQFLKQVAEQARE